MSKYSRKARGMRVALRRCKSVDAALVLINEYRRAIQAKLPDPRWLEKLTAKLAEKKMPGTSCPGIEKSEIVRPRAS